MSTTLWGQSASIEKIGVGQVIVIKGAKTSNYGGISLNVDDNSSIEINPSSVEKTHQLQNWYMSNKSNGSLATESLTQKGGDPQINIAQLPFSSIQEMNETLMADQAN